MRIKHFSDNHSEFLKLTGLFDLICSTGDFLPNYGYHIKSVITEQSLQLDWIRQHQINIKEMIKDKPFVFINGNHDFLDSWLFEQELISFGIKAKDVTNKIVNIENTNFYGFSYIPETGGGWANELNPKAMQLAVNELIDVLKTNSIDVLLLHCPPTGTISGQYANKILANALNYLSDEHKPKLILAGHLHLANGIKNEFGILTSNAATTQHIIEL